MPKYTATTPIKHDGKRYGVGDKLTIDADDARALLAVGAIDDARESAADRKAAEKAEADRKAQADAEAAEKSEADRLAADLKAAGTGSSSVVNSANQG